jgi:GTP-binding protein
VQASWPELEEKLKSRGYEPMAISAVAGTNVRELLFRASELLAKTPVPTAEIEVPVYRPEEDPREFSIMQENDAWRVEGVSIERAAAMTYWEYDQSVRRFQRILETIGIDKALREKGVEPGDTVLIGEHELEWED